MTDMNIFLIVKCNGVRGRANSCYSVLQCATVCYTYFSVSVADIYPIIKGREALTVHLTLYINLYIYIR